MDKTKLNSGDLLTGGLNNATKIIQKIHSKGRVMKLHWGNTVIVNIAKKLYLQPIKSWGVYKRKYSYRDIQEILQEDYKTKVAHTTIYRWAKKYNWEKDFQELLLEIKTAEKALDNAK